MGGKISYVTIGLIRNPDGFLICKDNFPRLPVGLKIKYFSAGALDRIIDSALKMGRIGISRIPKLNYDIPRFEWTGSCVLIFLQLFKSLYTGGTGAILIQIIQNQWPVSRSHTVVDYEHRVVRIYISVLMVIKIERIVESGDFKVPHV